MRRLTSFQHQIGTEAELRELLGHPSELVRNKVIDHLDHHCRDFIRLSPYLVLSTANSDGACDASPRGDAPGFVHVLDERRIVIPERPGNRRMDSLLNILSNSQVGIIFMIPGLEETLRVNGAACVIRDEVILSQMEVNGRRPIVGIGIEVEECYIHCAKSFKRSRLWQPDSWPEPSELPNPAKILAEHAAIPGLTPTKVTESLTDSYANRLY
ncbi:pyridoxamine 5'-phosphate oxidase family protein [Alicyclobacillus fastidiosus]|uniref:Pyridoxamine 5'-phosphate oxidase family protein n=1 Tax=Alicyclobacillus fastidiosus TaxID=392011 RepID=A0ABY6ZM05_9BACL|nr:pyridoxamine 5'-phosphate oxidase family protein [Alicyclobacillus fastidiosus]WAH43924.1 pyridoxamine 5'-phosphate oxidase family protein [Alicyclobacillus fastidiosus]GMA60171.1 phosphohydrolase [Alicyclobacillus fastidiosus]